MEMNTRLQVEHPVTEAITGLDLVEWQFRIAAGEQLPLAQAQVPLQGHAVEARIYAEDPARGFLPSTGPLVALSFPAALRVDTGVEPGSAISPYYDPMIAKMVAHAATREAALDQLASGLDRTVAAGPYTNLGLLAALCRAEEFRTGRFDTDFVEGNIAALSHMGMDHAAAALGAARLLRQDTARIERARESDAPLSPWDATDGFQLSGIRQSTMPIMVDGEPVEATVSYGSAGPSVAVDGVTEALDATAIEAADAIYVLHHGRQTVVRRADTGAGNLDHADGDGLIKAPMHGKVLALLVAEGDMVEKGQRVAIIEAMKMEHTLVAPRAGRIAEIAVTGGNQVIEGAKVMVIEYPGP
jgi:3-methylcrotonyl-CoA carboxylase alpha subunit